MPLRSSVWTRKVARPPRTSAFCDRSLHNTAVCIYDKSMLVPSMVTSCPHKSFGIASSLPAGQHPLPQSILNATRDHSILATMATSPFLAQPLQSSRKNRKITKIGHAKAGVIALLAGQHAQLIPYAVPSPPPSSSQQQE